MASRDSHETMGKRLRVLREAKGWSLAYVSSRTGIPMDHLSLAQADKVLLTQEAVRTLATLYKVSPEYIKNGGHPAGSNLKLNVEAFSTANSLTGDEEKKLLRAAEQYNARNPVDITDDILAALREGLREQEPATISSPPIQLPLDIDESVLKDEQTDDIDCCIHCGKTQDDHRPSRCAGCGRLWDYN